MKCVKFLILFGLMLMPISAQTSDKEDTLRGKWKAVSVVTGGKDVSPEAAEFIELIFKKKIVIVKGNFGKKSREKCAYKLNSTTAPKQLDILPPSQKRPVLAIYELNDDKLKLCIRRTPVGARPQNFDAGADEDLTVIVFKRQK